MNLISKWSWIVVAALMLVTANLTAQQDQPPPEQPPVSPAVAPDLPQPDAVDAAEEAEEQTQEQTIEPAPVGTAVSEQAPRPSVLRLGSDYTVALGDRVRELTAVAGSVTIEGQVEREVVVILGTTRLASTAIVRELVVVGGDVVVEPGAVVERGFVVLGGTLESPPEFAPGGEEVVIGSALVGDRLRGAVPWLTRGLLWGRPIVPELPWVWGFVAVFFLVYLVLNVVLDRPVRACAQSLSDRPLSAFLTGLIVLALVGPISFVLAVSVVGIVVIPFLLCALLVASILGRVGAARWLGSRVVAETSPESRQQSVRSFVIGAVVISLAYMVPVLGLITWTTLGVFGLGAVTMSFFAGLRRENPAPPAPVPQPMARLTVEAAEVEGSASAAASPVSSSDPATTSDLIAFPRAGFLNRLAALALDLLLVLMIVVVLGLAEDGPGPFFALMLGYHVVFWAWKGTTVGGIICQLRLVRTDGTSLRVADALVRGLSSIFSVAVLGIGYLWILRDADRQAWHDRIAGTYVVRVPRNLPLP